MARHLLVTNDFPPKTGGIQTYLYELWRRLEPGRAVVLTASSHADAARFDRGAGVQIERVPGETLYLPTPRVRRAVRAAIARHDPDLVLLDPAWPLGLLGPTLGRPYGLVVHGAEIGVTSRIPLVASSLRSALRHAKVIVSAGEYPEAVARRVAAEYLAPVVNVPPGVDTSRFRPLDAEQRRHVRKVIGVDEHALLVVSYSRLVPRKGMDTLIRAAALLRENFPSLTVAIGGAGRDRERLVKLVERHRAPVTFVGRVPDRLLPEWLGAADLMVMDCRSRWLGLEQEGFGIVFVEAAAAGVAQVAGRSGGSHEAVDHGVTGLVVDNPLSARDLAQAIGDVLADADRRARYGAASRAAAVENFDWDHLARRLGDGLAPFDHQPTASAPA
ncbi:MAG TPA: glycosyltransferase family 4 protein [Acidimicrobiales bacterium]|nr:glycosyltransferase family 4 protein [Acidimicrobiales bacterium]